MINFLTIKQAAFALEVSEASIKNWIKTGYLKSDAHNRILYESFRLFKSNIAGKDKLTKRANKLFKKDNLNLKKGSFSEHEKSFSEAQKNKEGIYYTPDSIVQYFFQKLPGAYSKKTFLKNKTFCDPCCGTGNFIVEAAEYGFDPSNIYGFDIDPKAVKIAAERLYNISGYKTPNIMCSDFLSYSLNNKLSFDVIFTNPPWGKKLNSTLKKELSLKLNAKNSKDTSSFFLIAALNSLKEGGHLGFLLQEAFFNIGSFKDVRLKLLDYEIKEIKDFGRPFNSLLTKAVALSLKKTKSSKSSKIRCEGNKFSHLRKQQSFKLNAEAIFNFQSSQRKTDIIEQLFKIPHITLKGRVDFAMGIVTGNNNKLCSNICDSESIPVYRGRDIFKDHLLKPSCYIKQDFSKFQQTAPERFYKFKNKLIYRFISSDLIFYHDTEGVYILNSANLLILKDNFPISAKQLASLLNSKMMNQLFKDLFNTKKVLRKDLEYLPIHYKYFNRHTVFDDDLYFKYLGF